MVVVHTYIHIERHTTCTRANSQILETYSPMCSKYECSSLLFTSICTPSQNCSACFTIPGYAQKREV